MPDNQSIQSKFRFNDIHKYACSSLHTFSWYSAENAKQLLQASSIMTRLQRVVQKNTHQLGWNALKINGDCGELRTSEFPPTTSASFHLKNRRFWGKPVSQTILGSGGSRLKISQKRIRMLDGLGRTGPWMWHLATYLTAA